MESFEVNKILDLYHSNDYSEVVKKWKPPCVPNKSNHWLYLEELREFDFVRDIINRDLQSVDERYICGEFFTLLIYKKGDFFSKHNDKSPDSGLLDEEEVKLSLSGGYYLNDNYTGGDFILGGKRLESNIGEIFIFGRDVLHEVTEVTDGMRYTLHFGVEMI